MLLIVRQPASLQVPKKISTLHMAIEKFTVIFMCVSVCSYQDSRWTRIPKLSATWRVNGMGTQPPPTPSNTACCLNREGVGNVFFSLMEEGYAERTVLVVVWFYLWEAEQMPAAWKRSRCLKGRWATEARWHLVGAHVKVARNMREQKWRESIQPLAQASAL